MTLLLCTASYLGLKEFLPPYLDPNLTNQELISGVSFASDGSGYDTLTPTLSNVISIRKQLEHFKEYKNRLERILEDYREEKSSISARVFHSISFTTILSSSSSAVSLVRQSSPPQHASDDGATCFRRRRARRCLNAWSKGRFGLRQAETWWSENRDKVYKRYNVHSSAVKSSNQAGAPHRTEGAGSIEGHCTRVLFKSKL
ncbi:hypothetical protein S83_053814 [Arachis hypogaea]